VSVDEGLQYARQFGYVNDEIGLLALRARIAALQGREQDCRDDAAEAMRRSLANGIGWATINARLALGELELGLGNPAEALAQIDQIDRTPVPPIWMMAVPDLVDAALRVGERERAVEAVEAYAAWAPVTRATHVHATLARTRAQVADGDGAETLFGEALELHRLEASPFERARTELAYGEWLRRERRKTDARVQLRTALDTFEGMGASLWAERARGELQATGETARKRDPSTIDDLTPQELRIAHLVADGATNRDVAAQLFVSPKTVEYHLRKVFMKLGVKSRVELAGAQLDPLADPN
jgi:DNA-binding CsgD family transcriptional regulator